jgi:hypothetical protein
VAAHNGQSARGRVRVVFHHQAADGALELHGPELPDRLLVEYELLVGLAGLVSALHE